jgi:type IV pilus assembly protein PilO
MNLSELNFRDPGSLPGSVKFVACLLIVALVVAAGYLLVFADQYEQLDSRRQQEVSLKADYEKKAMEAASLEDYRAQNRKLQSQLKKQLQQLPNTDDIATLLDDVSFRAMDHGLKIEVIKWDPEQKLDDYTVLPMEISVVGEYAQLGKFVEEIGKIKRIVAITQFQLTHANGKGGVVQTGPNGALPKDADQLAMHMVAKTYRYNQPVDNKKANNKAGGAR